MKRLLPFLLLCLFVAMGAHAAPKAPDLPNLRFALRESPHAPGMTFAGRDISAELYTFVSGGWGRDAQSVCVLRPPAMSEGQLLSLFLTQMQEGLIRFRSTLESAASDAEPRACFEADAIRREMFFAPDMRILERVDYELTCIDADILAEIENSGQKPAEATEKERERIFASMTRLPRSMWFDSTDFLLHNASVLWKTSPENAARLFFRESGADAYNGRFAAMPDPLQSSVYLRITPQEFFDLHPDLVQYKGLVSGGWGYAREDALIVAVSPEEKGRQDTRFSGAEESAFSFRSILEQAQPLSAAKRLYPLMHEKKEQRLIEEAGRRYDSITCTLLLATNEQFNEFLGLREKGDTQGIAEAVTPKLTRRESRMWFDISESFSNNGEMLFKKQDTAPNGMTGVPPSREQ